MSASPDDAPATDAPATDAPATDDATVFAEHRSLLFTVAYEMLGSVADAEDVVSESYLRWVERPANTVVQHPRAYLVRIVTRLSLNRLRTVARRREDYVGPWLPEPVLTVPDVVDDVVLAESVSLALLVLLESLSPAERAVFVLRDVFGYSYDEIADAVDKSSAAVRQIAHRAHDRIRERRPRFDADAATAEQVRSRFAAAMFGGDLQSLMDVLAPDVVLLSDGGGKVSAARRPLNGADPVARFLLGIARKGDLAGGRTVIEEVLVNNAPAWLMSEEGRPIAVAQLTVLDGLVQTVHVVSNPDKLGGIDRTRPLTLG
ncbi:MAG TPA: RNA polymerase sigma-70 factor [Microlunatus sp.]|nr:RNA polymerase sigma-70 factor [Microlunatus sp.]